MNRNCLDNIYDNGWVTNNSPMVQELERRLADSLGVKNMVLVTNGIVALEIAYRLLKLEKEVVTAPFSFVATISSLVSNSLKPILFLGGSLFQIPSIQYAKVKIMMINGKKH